MYTQPFPPVILTNLTKDNALSYEACGNGIEKFINSHRLSNLTAVPVATLLKSKRLSHEAADWIKHIAGLNVSLTEYGYQHGDGCGNASGFKNKTELGDGSGRGDCYGFGSGNGDGSGDGYGSGYGDEHDNDDGDGDGDILL